MICKTHTPTQGWRTRLALYVDLLGRFVCTKKFARCRVESSCLHSRYQRRICCRFLWGHAYCILGSTELRRENQNVFLGCFREKRSLLCFAQMFLHDVHAQVTRRMPVAANQKRSACGAQTAADPRDNSPRTYQTLRVYASQHQTSRRMPDIHGNSKHLLGRSPVSLPRGEVEPVLFSRRLVEVAHPLLRPLELGDSGDRPRPCCQLRRLLPNRLTLDQPTKGAWCGGEPTCCISMTAETLGCLSHQNVSMFFVRIQAPLSTPPALPGVLALDQPDKMGGCL